MTSTYAPLPFSYLGPGNPRVGLRKDGVYGTSADVPRVYGSESQPQDSTAEGGFPVNSHSIYANANGNAPNAHPGSNYDEVYMPRHQQQQLQPVAVLPTGRGPMLHDQAHDGRFPPSETGMIRSQIPESPYGGHSSPESPYSRLPRSEPFNGDGIYAPRQRETPNSEFRDPVVRRPPDANRQLLQGIPSQYPPGGVERQTYETIDRHDATNHTDRPSKPSDMTPKEFDNFILVKDAKRPDTSTTEAGSSTNQPSRNKLQNLFEVEESKKQLPRYNTPPPHNHINNGEPKKKKVPTATLR